MSQHVVMYRIEAVDQVSSVLQRIDTLNTKVKSGVAGIRDHVSKITAPVRSVQAHFSNLVPVVKKVHTQIQRGATDLINFPKKIKAGFDFLRRNLGDFGAFMVAQFSTQTIFQFFNKAKSLAVDLNESMNKGRVVFGDYYADIEDYASKADKLSGFSKNAALSYASSFGSMFKELGVHGKDLATLSSGAVKLASDLASFNNVDPGQAFEALFSGIKGETEVLASNFGIVIDEMMIKKKAIDMGLVSKKDASSTLSKEIKVMAAYQLIIDKTSDAQGDFARTSDQAANKERILQAAVENKTAAIGSIFLPIYDKLLTKLIAGVEWISKNGAELKFWAFTIIKVAAAVGISAIAYNILTGAINLSKLAMIAFNFVASINPFVWIGIAILAIISIVRYWDTIRVYLIKWGTWLLTWIVKLNPMSYIIRFFKWLWNKMDSLFPGIKERVGAAFSWVVDKLLALGKIIWKYLPWNLLLTGLDYIFPGLKEKFYKIIDWIMDKILGFVDWFKGSVIGQIISKTFDLKWDVKTPAVPKKKEDKTEAKTDASVDPYSDASRILNASKDNKDKPGSPKGDLGGSINSMTKGDGVSGGGNLKNINIRIDKLVEKLIIETQNLGMSENQVRASITRTLLTAVNDVNYG